MQEGPTSFTELLQGKILPNVQRIALLLAVAGLAFSTLHYPGADQLLLIGFSTLAMSYFLMAFIPLHIPVGCKPDLYTSIIYKIIYIGCSATTIGILFQFLKFNGAREILMIGSSTTGLALLVAGFLFARNRDNWIVLKDAVIRGGVLFLLSVYLMRQASII
jgi:hypothetical protein